MVLTNIIYSISGMIELKEFNFLNIQDWPLFCALLRLCPSSCCTLDSASSSFNTVALSPLNQFSRTMICFVVSLFNMYVQGVNTKAKNWRNNPAIRKAFSSANAQTRITPMPSTHSNAHDRNVILMLTETAWWRYFRHSSDNVLLRNSFPFCLKY